MEFVCYWNLLIYLLEKALTSPTIRCRSVGIVRWRTQTMEFVWYWNLLIYLLEKALTSPTSCCRSVGIVRWRTKATELWYLFIYFNCKDLCYIYWDILRIAQFSRPQNRLRCRPATSPPPSGTATTRQVQLPWRHTTPNSTAIRTTLTAQRLQAPTPGIPTTSSTVRPPLTITTGTSDLWYFWDPIHTNRAFRSTEIPGQVCPPQFWILANAVEKCSHFFEPCAGHPHYVMITVTNHLYQWFGRHKSPLVWQVMFYQHVICTQYSFKFSSSLIKFRINMFKWVILRRQILITRNSWRK
jgi:hypothetical protein